jgi:hypothetical protein
MADENAAAMAVLVLRVKELEAQVARLEKQLLYNAEKQKNYRRRKLKITTAARSDAVTSLPTCSNGSVTDAVTKQSRNGNKPVTPLPTTGDAALFPLPHTPSQDLDLDKSKITKKYSSPLADFVAATWPQKPLTAELEKTWREAYPGLDLLAAARSARAWQLEALAQRTRPRALAFLGNWFRAEQQKLRAPVAMRRNSGAALQINPHLSEETAGRKML